MRLNARGVAPVLPDSDLVGGERWGVHASRLVDVAEFIVFCEGCGKDPAVAIQAMRQA